VLRHWDGSVVRELFHTVWLRTAVLRLWEGSVVRELFHSLWLRIAVLRHWEGSVVRELFHTEPNPIDILCSVFTACVHCALP
jgi:hypothetical protein